MQKTEHWYLLCSDDDPLWTTYTNQTTNRKEMSEKFVGKMVPNGGDEEYDLSHCIGVALEHEI